MAIWEILPNATRHVRLSITLTLPDRMASDSVIEARQVLVANARTAVRRLQKLVTKRPRGSQEFGGTRTSTVRSDSLRITVTGRIKDASLSTYSIDLIIDELLESVGLE